MIKLVAAPNAFKGSLTSCAAAAAIASGARRALPNLEVMELGIADGGDGTAEVLCRARGGSFREALVTDPRGRPLTARYGWLDDGSALIDVATASGLALLLPGERDARRASSYGTGQLLRAALRAGAQRIVLGVGGSASVDGGAGLLQALGARLLDGDGRELTRGGAALAKLARIDLSGLEPRARRVPIDVACDVDSLLLGELGAARLFGPQKGATPADVEQLESSLSHFAAVVARDCRTDITRVTAGGAAGGIAAGLYGVLGARLVSGIELVLDVVDFERTLNGARLCITGEGRLDRQSLRNKGPLGVARRAAAQGVPTAALVGSLAGEVMARDFPQFARVSSIRDDSMPLERALRDAFPLLQASAEHLVRDYFSPDGAPPAPSE
jgi:glycerate 2-kinase